MTFRKLGIAIMAVYTVLSAAGIYVYWLYNPEQLPSAACQAIDCTVRYMDAQVLAIFGGSFGYIISLSALIGSKPQWFVTDVLAIKEGKL